MAQSAYDRRKGHFISAEFLNALPVSVGKLDETRFSPVFPKPMFGPGHSSAAALLRLKDSFKEEHTMVRSLPSVCIPASQHATLMHSARS